MPRFGIPRFKHEIQYPRAIDLDTVEETVAVRKGAEQNGSDCGGFHRLRDHSNRKYQRCKIKNARKCIFFTNY